MEEGVLYITVVMYISFISLRAYLQKEMALFDNHRLCRPDIAGTQSKLLKESKEN